MDEEIPIVLTLSGVGIGSSAAIDRFLSDDPALRRLRELGMLPGTEIKVIRHAPLGDPIEITVRGSHLSIRREEADLIAVNPLPDDEPES